VSDPDRRTAARVPVEMWVEEQSANAVYFQRSANVSVGGLYLENSVPHPVGTRMSIRFTLPGDDAPLQLDARIVRIEQAATLGMHLEFLEIPAAATGRLERFIARQLGGG
jgi:uncharacterized protein (TIGR02266 family)